jgi:hypothetical protein
MIAPAPSRIRVFVHNLPPVSDSVRHAAKKKSMQELEESLMLFQLGRIIQEHGTGEGPHLTGEPEVCPTCIGAAASLFI